MTEAYSIGILRCCICTDEPVEAALEWVNTHYHPGTRLGWVLSDDSFFATGESNPCPCEKNPNTHKHYLLEC